MRQVVQAVGFEEDEVHASIGRRCVPMLLHDIHVQNIGNTRQSGMAVNERRSALGEDDQKIDERRGLYPDLL